jgi:hypothetical protein
MVGYAAQHPLFGARVIGDIEELFHVGHDRLAATRAGDLSLGHVEFPIFFDLRFAVGDNA